MKRPIIHVVPGLGQSQGGPSYSVPRLCQAMRDAGAAVDLYSVDQAGDVPFAGVDARLWLQDFTWLPLAKEMRFSVALKQYLAKATTTASLVHAHGLWLMPNVEAGIAAHRAGVPLVVSPRGMLAPEALGFSRTKKWLFWKLLQRNAYAHAAAWHATSAAEADDIRAFGIRAPIAIVPNGIDLTTASAAMREQGRTLLSLGRIHPKKGLRHLVAAWANLAPEFSGWRLRIVGPDEAGHASELKTLATRLGASRLSIEPPVFGRDKIDVLLNASLFVLPTLNENFGIAVAEALGAGVPAVVTKGAPWAGLLSNRCGWWIDNGVEPLVAALRIAMNLPDGERKAMGARGRAWMARDFSWNRIAKDMLDVYVWIRDGGAPPVTVQFP